ncbi:MAG TPA: response regulator, partial [Verrucomicrobiae bacterium]|nr:response regulator [Verrucomicrobiae bacterium]
FTERGEVFVHVSRETCPDGPQALVKFSVRDTGIGITPEARRRIFQAFTQADGSTTRKYGGTGLGLAISRQLIELFGGTIDVHSEAGQGSTFIFTARFDLQPHGNAHLKQPADLSGKRILVVDDNATNRQILHHQLGAAGVTVISCASGPDAMRLFLRASETGEQFDLAILDMHMPQMDGLALAQIIKADPRTTRTPLVMLTSLSHRFEPGTVQAVGLEAYLVKPVKQARLLECLANVLSNKHPAQIIPLEGPSGQESHGSSDAPGESQLRILVVEDNNVNQRVALRQLKKLGHTATAVENGEKAVQAVAHFHYDIIFMDCHMPVMDGYEATRQIRRLPRNEQGEAVARPYIVAMTANALKGDREKCLAAGMDDYLSKPVNLQDIEAALRRAERHEPVAPPPESEDAPPTIDEKNVEQLRELASDDAPDALGEFIDVFLDQTPLLLEKIHASIEAANGQELHRAAHTLKGSAANFGARPLVALCARMEKIAAGERFLEAHSCAAEIDHESARVVGALKKIPRTIVPNLAVA